jgi:eukaryotic-like serine/threonine-protein kinase
LSEIVDNLKNQTQTSAKVCLTCKKEFSGTLSSCPDDGGQLMPVKRDPLVGTIFAERYEIISVLGTGGMSVVYKARHRYMDRLVAVKLLLSHLVLDNSAIQRFQQEAQAASSLGHQNIIAVYDFGVTPDNQAFLVMDYLDGENLADVLERDSRIPASRAIEVFRQVCDGLEHAHRKGIIHRDLKPSNLVLMVQEDGSELVKLVDFGIAKFLPQEGKMRQQLTHTGQVFGSPLYMSPEQCIGAKLDARSDLYSLGCLMYEALTGVHPLKGATSFETMNRHVKSKPLPFSQVAPDIDVPDDLEAIVFKCLEKDPAMRFQSAAEIRQSLPGFAMTMSGVQGAVSSTSIPAVSRTTVERIVTVPAEPPRKLKKRILIGAALGVIGAGLVGYVAFWPGPANDRAPVWRKTYWTWCMWSAQQAEDRGDNQSAHDLLMRAEEQAKEMGDNQIRLVGTLKEESDNYAKLGRYQDQENTNKRILEISRQQILREYDFAMKDLDSLSSASVESVSATMNRLRAEANAERLIGLARRLHSFDLFEKEEKLLEKGIKVYTLVAGEDYLKLSDLYTLLADCIMSLQRTPEVRPLLVNALEIRLKAEGDTDVSTVRALLKLGQFDRDQTNFDLAEGELKKALEIVRKEHSNDKPLLIACLNSYADFLRQSGNKEEATKLFTEAKEYERQNHALN